MHLEKVTSRSSEAALAGWISSNDVTLFTTVLVVAIAIFLHSRVNQGTREKTQISNEKVALAKRLDTTANERDAINALLAKTQKSLTLTQSETDALNALLGKTQKTLDLTQSERDQLQKQLIDKLADISQLNAKLDALLKEKGELESQRQSLVATKESLSKEKTQLLAQQATLTENRDALKTSNADLLQRLSSITDQLTKKVAALEQVEQQRDRLKKQADELDTIVAGLKQKMEKLNIDLADTRAQAAAARTRSQSKAQELESQLAARDKTAEEYLARLKRAAALFEGLKTEKEQLQRTVSEAESKHQAELIEEGRNNRELVGLTGRLERVAVLFDASGSMRNAANVGGNDRWAEAQQIAETWLQHLNVQRCVLIVFSSTVRTFPENGSLADLSGPGGKANRESLLQQVKAVSPGGWTNTYDALRKAYQYDIDSILLFSDGAPSRSDSGLFDPAMVQQIYGLCRAHPKIPIHTIGLGNYFDKDASNFLQSIAKLSGGSFRGR